LKNHIENNFILKDLPKSILFKMVSMDSEELQNEDPLPYSNDVRQLLSPTSFQRLKSAHKNEYQ
jgi:hypothetical protein